MAKKCVKPIFERPPVETTFFTWFPATAIPDAFNRGAWVEFDKCEAANAAEKKAFDAAEAQIAADEAKADAAKLAAESAAPNTNTAANTGAAAPKDNTIMIVIAIAVVGLVLFFVLKPTPENSKN
jgi:hypothetical protein